MKRVFWLGLLGLLVASLAAAGYACVEALTLEKMVAKTDAAIQGKITNVRTVRYQPPIQGEDRLIFTLITVEGKDLYTGEARTLEAGFLGGTYEGDQMLVTCAPHPSEYRLGNEVVIFSAPVEGWGPEVDRCVYAALGGIFRVNRNVVFGKGEGFAIEKNQKLSTLQEGVAAALKAKGVK